jgi:hypothetical protein
MHDWPTNELRFRKPEVVSLGLPTLLDKRAGTPLLCPSYRARKALEYCKLSHADKRIGFEQATRMAMYAE